MLAENRKLLAVWQGNLLFVAVARASEFSCAGFLSLSPSRGMARGPGDSCTGSSFAKQAGKFGLSRNSKNFPYQIIYFLKDWVQERNSALRESESHIMCSDHERAANAPCAGMKVIGCNNEQVSCWTNTDNDLPMCVCLRGHPPYGVWWYASPWLVFLPFCWYFMNIIFKVLLSLFNWNSIDI